MRLSVELERDVVAPRGEVAGRAAWGEGAGPVELELRLFWYTEGKGDRDVGIAETLAWTEPASGERSFAVRLPAGPISFSGRLISLVWAVELVDLASGESARAELLVSHTGEEIRIDADPERESIVGFDVVRPA